jgi:glycosyltransferase involved in cell wall biosynthesis
MRASFITWYPYCRRSDAIAEALGGSSHLVHYLSFKRPLHAPAKYVLQAVATLRILWREQPDLVLVAVPPIFAVLPALLFARIRRARLVIDAHTGIFAHARWRWLIPLTRMLCTRTDAVIVTGEHLRKRVAEWGATAVVIGDVPVHFVAGYPPPPCTGYRVAIVNTFSVDEPVDAVLAAARAVPEASFFVTGDTRQARRAWLAERPANLTFTGFVSEEEYAGLLRAADVIVVLTTHDYTMQRGAYEAVALGKPLVTSDWQLLRETFSRGAIHVRNDAAAIAAGIRHALANRESLSREMVALRSERDAVFASRLETLVRAVVSAEVGKPLSATSTPHRPAQSNHNEQEVI